MSLRLATTADGAGCAAIYDPICRHTAISFETEAPGAAEMARRITTTLPQLPWLVSADGDTILGFAYARLYRERAAYRWAVETSVYVADGLRGMGLGRSLYTALLAILEAQGYRTAVAGIAMPNDGSVRLHEAMGFRLVGVYPAIGYKLGAWRDVSRWHLSLNDAEGEPAEPRPVSQVVGSRAWDEAIARGTACLIRPVGS